MPTVNNNVNFAVGVGSVLTIGIGMILGGVLNGHHVVVMGVLCGLGAPITLFALYGIAIKVKTCFQEHKGYLPNRQIMSCKECKK